MRTALFLIALSITSLAPMDKSMDKAILIMFFAFVSMDVADFIKNLTKG